MSTEYYLSIDGDPIMMDQIQQAVSNNELEIDLNHIHANKDSFPMRVHDVDGSWVWTIMENEQLVGVTLYSWNNLAYIEDWLNSYGTWFEEKEE